LRGVTAFLLLLAAISFGLGISLPLLRVEKLYFFEETPSLLGLVAGLWNAGDLIIAALVIAFSILFPIIKLAVVFLGAFAPQPNGSGTDSQIINSWWMPVLAKWSMMDVLLVALVIFAAKTSGFATAFAQPGLWFYAISAVAGALAANFLKKINGGSSRDSIGELKDQEGARSPGS